MQTAPLKSFATWARTTLLRQVDARVATVLAPGSRARVEEPGAVTSLEKAITAAGGGATGRTAVVDRVAYTWFNRIIALRFMDANGYTGIGVVSPLAGATGQPEILADAKRGNLDPDVVRPKAADAVSALLDGARRSDEPQSEAYGILLAEYCHHWNRAMPFMFEKEGDYTELLMPANLLATSSVMNRAVEVLTEEVCQNVEVIGWLYQFYISERKGEVFAGFKKSQKAGADEIPAATQLFTPHWIVRYLVENSLGRLWMLNRPNSGLASQMDYYIVPVDEATNFLKITKPEELKIIDPACGSGHMLTYAFDILYSIYEEEGYGPAEIPGLILTHNLYGTEIDPRAGALAAFALTMKARGKQRTFFNKQVEPNICVIEPISFSPDELALLVTKDGNEHAEEAFWNQYAEADTFGSLIKPDPGLTDRLARHLESLDDGGDLFLTQQTIPKAIRVHMQVDYLTPPYAVVIANPPYMGAGNMGRLLSSFAKEHYPASRTDLFAMFIELCIRLAGGSGQVGMITMQSWMFLASFERLRAKILREGPPIRMAHLGERAFDSIGGSVVSTTAFVLQVGAALREVGSYVRLVDGRTEAEKAQMLRAATAGVDTANVYGSAGDNFAQIPGTPIVYWLSDDVRRAFTLGRPLGSVAELREGLSSSDADRFVRLWWEVPTRSLELRAPNPDAAKASGARWFPFNKGGDFRKWYGNHEHVINWQNGGAEILAERPKSTVRSPQYYFRPCVSWSKISTGSPAFRRYPEGFVLGSAAKSVYVDSEQQATLIMSICNSSLVQVLLEAKSPTMSFVAEDVGSLPILRAGAPDDVVDLVEELTDNSMKDWDASENSWNFLGSPLLGRSEAEPLARVFADYDRQWTTITLRQQELEGANNVAIAKLYGLEHEVATDVPLDRITLTRNLAFRYSGKSEDVQHVMFRQDTIKDLISYAIGCMFGRYSLNEPGLILTDQSATLQDYLARVPSPSFMPDADNVIPVVEGDWFDDDIIERFRQFLRVAFGEQHFEENLQFVTESLGVKDVRDYFVKSFYKDHVQRYKKRPIYWLFSSPKGSFNALIYMHRYTPSTVSTVLNDYLREYKGKLEASLANHERQVAGGAGAPKQQAAARKEADRLRKVILELDEYEHDVLYPLATQQVAIDLDDGVKVNYSKFGDALKRVAGLEASE